MGWFSFPASRSYLSPMANAGNGQIGGSGTQVGAPPIDPSLPAAPPYGMPPGKPPKIVSPVYIIAPAPFADRYQIRPGSNLTPGFITNVLKQADIGYFWEQADLFDEAREKDTHLHTVLAKREDAIAGAEWELRAPPGEQAERMAPINEYLTAVLNALGNFPEIVAHLVGGVYQGRGVAEQLWAKDRAGNPTYPAEMFPVHARRCAMVNNWRLHLWDATSPSQNPEVSDFPGVAFDEYPRGKFLVHQPRVFGGYPTREGLGRLLVWYSAFRTWTIRDWMAYAEMIGRPLRFAEYKAGGTGEGEHARDEDVAKILDDLRAMSGAVSITHPDTIKVNLPNLGRQRNDVHDALTSFCNAEMSKAVLHQTLTTEAGTRGARALGTVHADVETQVAKRDAAAVSATLRRDLFTPAVRRKFGADAPVPQIAFIVDREGEKQAYANMLKVFVSLGGKVSQAHARNKLGIEDPKPGDDLLIPMLGAGGKVNQEVLDIVQRTDDSGAAGGVEPKAASSEPNEAGGPEANEGKGDAREDTGAQDAGAER